MRQRLEAGGYRMLRWMGELAQASSQRESLSSSAEKPRPPFGAFLPLAPGLLRPSGSFATLCVENNKDKRWILVWGGRIRDRTRSDVSSRRD